MTLHESIKKDRKRKDLINQCKELFKYDMKKQGVRYIEDSFLNSVFNHKGIRELRAWLKLNKGLSALRKGLI